MNKTLQLATLALLLTPFSRMVGASPKIAPDLTHISPQATVSVIIQFSSPLDHAGRQVLLKQGGILKADLDFIHSASYTVRASGLEKIAALPQVAHISPDRAVKATLDYANAAVGAQAAFQAGWDGAGIGIAVIDSGITGNADLNAKDGPKRGSSRIL